MNLRIVGLICFTSMIAACGPTKRDEKSQEAATKAGHQTSIFNDADTVNNVTSPRTIIQGDLELSKAEYNALLKEPMLFGANLQIGEQKDELTALSTSQVLSPGAHYIANFVRLPSKLQLLADTSVKAESDYPMKQILLEFDVIAENSHKISLRIAKPAIGAALQWGLKNVNLSWIRSISFDPKDKTVVIESSVRDEVAGGTFHFLESSFPRGRFGNQANAIVKEGPNYPSTESEEKFSSFLERLGTFSVESFIPEKSANPGEWHKSVVKKALKTALHYDISEDRTIDWWASANTPEPLLKDLAAGVEGWNRYFNMFRPQAKVMRFMGKLPEGVKLGDFRYNVVQFDAVADAGAAYESQNYDPITGIQTNSMIYMPYAWYNIGVNDYVDEADTPQHAPNALIKSRTKCLRSQAAPEGVASLFGTKARSANAEGKALMRATLIHEVGHALGMEHNFSGSASGVLGAVNNQGWTYSNSVMDYNVPNLEDSSIFTGNDAEGNNIDPTQGARLKYDEQFIDIIYNKAALVSATPSKYPVVPFCNDAEADDHVMGVNPTCIRYDFFSTHLEALDFANARVTADTDVLDSSMGKFYSLKGILGLVKNRNLKALTDATPDTVDEVLESALKETFSALRQTTYAGYISYRTAATVYMPLLGEWKALPEGLMKDSDDAALHSWNTLPIFDAAGKVSEDLYTKYQQSVRERVTAIVVNGLVGLTGEKTPFQHAIAKAQLSMLELSQAVLARTDLSDEARASIKNSTITMFAKAKAATVSVGTRMITELAKLNWKGVAEDDKGNASVGRPNVSTDIAQEILNALVKVAEETKVAPKLRQASVIVVGEIMARNTEWDKTAHTNWTTKITEMSQKLKDEFSALDKTLRETKYLSAANRERHEALAKMIDALEKI